MRLIEFILKSSLSSRYQQLKPATDRLEFRIPFAFERGTAFNLPVSVLDLLLSAPTRLLRDKAGSDRIIHELVWLCARVPR